MNDVQQVVAEPSAATIELPQLTSEIKAKWNKNEEVPPQTSEPAPTETPTKQVEPEAKAESAAEPGAAPKQEKPKKEVARKPDAEERIHELTAKVRELEERERKREAAAKPPVESKTEAPPERPNPFKWTGTPEEYEEAIGKWETHQKQQAIAEFRQQQAQQEAARQTSDMLKQTAEKYPDADTKVNQAATELMSKAPEYVKAFVNDSEVITDMLYTLSDGNTLDKILDMAKTSPGKVLRALRDMELDIQKKIEPPEPEAKTESEEPPAPPKPRAPKPPAEVGGRGTTPDDALESAALAKDFRAFKAEANRRALAPNRAGKVHA